MTDIYEPYRQLLAGKPVPIEEDRPYPGRYKLRRSKDGPFLPVAIGPTGNGEIAAQVDGKPADPLEIWVSCAKRPVPPADYKFRMENGYWPDEPAPITRTHNLPSDPYEALRAVLDDKMEQAEGLLRKHPEVTTQETCDLLANMRTQLQELHKRADELHKTEKAPHIEAGRKVDERFRFRETLTNLTANLKLRFGAFMIREQGRLQKEADEKRRAVEIERARVQAERAKMMEDDPIAAHTGSLPELPDLPSAEVKVRAGGAVGRKAGLAAVWVPVMTDYAAALAHFADNAKVRELVEKLGQQAVKAGARNVPGFEVRESRRVA